MSSRRTRPSSVPPTRHVRVLGTERGTGSTVELPASRVGPDPGSRERLPGQVPRPAHFAAAIAVANGAHPKTLQARLGHASITMTLDTYGYLFDGLDADLADRMDETHQGRSVTALRRSS